MYFMDEPPVDYDRKYPLNYKKYECENAIAIQHEKQQEIRNNYEIIKVSVIFYEKLLIFYLKANAT